SAQSRSFEDSSGNVPARPRDAVEIQNLLHAETGALHLLFQFFVRITPVVPQRGIEGSEDILTVWYQNDRASVPPQRGVDIAQSLHVIFDVLEHVQAYHRVHTLRYICKIGRIR